MDRYKKNEAIKVNYIVIKKTTGLTDVVMHVYDEAGVELGSGLSPVAMTEIVGGGGLYYGSFTPDANGQWRIRIQSTVNGDDVQRVFEVGDYKLDDVKGQTQDIEDKVDVIDGNVTAIDGKVDDIKAKTENLPADTASELQDIKDKIDAVDLQIDKGGYIL